METAADILKCKSTSEMTNTLFRLEMITSGEYLKLHLIEYVENQKSCLTTFMAMSTSMVNLYECEINKLNFFSRKKKKELLTSYLETNRKFTIDFEKSIAELDTCVDALNNGKIVPDMISIINAGELLLSRFKEQLKAQSKEIDPATGKRVGIQWPL